MLQSVNFVDLMRHLWQYVVMQFGKQTTIYTTCHGAGCGRKVPSNVWYCERCKGKAKQPEPNKQRGAVDDTEARRLRSTTAWTKFSRYTLMTYPLCADPFNEHNGPVLAKQVHHIKPLSTHPELLLEPSNVASLCITCHNRIEGLHRSGRQTAHYFNSPTRQKLPT